jgi:UDP-glucose 4-epimerase
MYGLRYVALRYFNVYGPRMDTDGKYTEVMIKWLDCVRSGTALSFTETVYADGFRLCAGHSAGQRSALLADVTDEVFNNGCSRETSLKELSTFPQGEQTLRWSPSTGRELGEPVSRRLADISGTGPLGFEPQVSLRMVSWEHDPGGTSRLRWEMVTN